MVIVRSWLLVSVKRDSRVDAKWVCWEIVVANCSGVLERVEWKKRRKEMCWCSERRGMIWMSVAIGLKWGSVGI